MKAIGALLAVAILVASCSAEPSGSASPSGVVSPSATPMASEPAPTNSNQPSPSFAPITLAVHPIAQVVASSPLEVRSAPGTGADSIVLPDRLWPGMRVGLLRGPIDASGYRWYRVRVGDITGWAAAGSVDGDAWLASVHNGRIAFGARAPANAGVEILSLELDGTGVRQLAIIPMSEALPLPTGAALRPVLQCGSSLTPAWSSDGTWLSFVSALDCFGVIFTLRSDGSGLLRLAEGRGAAWAPSGSTLAFDINIPYCGGPPCDDGGPWDLFGVQLPGGNPTRLTQGGYLDGSVNPLWSPDGSLIAFTRFNGNETRGTYLVQSDGAHERRLTDGSLAGWLPDGSGVVVSRELADFSGSEWFIVAVDGSEKALAGGFGSLSPDGRWMVTTGWDADHGQPTAAISRLVGGEQIALPSGWNALAWTPDGGELIFSVQDAVYASTNLMSLELGTGRIRSIYYFGTGQLAEFGGFAVQPVLVNDLN